MHSLESHKQLVNCALEYLKQYSYEDIIKLFEKNSIKAPSKTGLSNLKNDVSTVSAITWRKTRESFELLLLKEFHLRFDADTESFEYDGSFGDSDLTQSETLTKEDSSEEKNENEEVETGNVIHTKQYIHKNEGEQNYYENNGGTQNFYKNDTMYLQINENGDD